MPFLYKSFSADRSDSMPRTPHVVPPYYLRSSNHHGGSAVGGCILRQLFTLPRRRFLRACMRRKRRSLGKATLLQPFAEDVKLPFYTHGPNTRVEHMYDHCNSRMLHVARPDAASFDLHFDLVQREHVVCLLAWAYLKVSCNVFDSSIIVPCPHAASARKHHLLSSSVA